MNNIREKFSKIEGSRHASYIISKLLNNCCCGFIIVYISKELNR